MSTPEKLFITGATGFLGGAVLAQRLMEGNVNNTLVLARADSPEEALNRVKEQMRLFEIAEDTLRLLTTDQIVFGDLGSTQIHDDPRLQDVGVIINCAAVPSFGNNPRIFSVNVEDTFVFAKGMSTLPRLRRFIHIGTAMACGAQAESPIFEHYEPDEAQHLVPYTESKEAIEKRLQSELPGLPLIVARPSIVVGHSRLGCGPSSSIFWVFRMAKMLGEFMCDIDHKVDVVPVDWCADILLRLAAKPELKYPRYHLSAGIKSNTFREIDAAMSKAMGVEIMHDFRRAELSELMARRDQFPAMFGTDNQRIIIKAIQLYGGFSSLSFLFDNSNLQDEGFPEPPHFTDYLHRCIETSQAQTIAEQMIVDFK